MDATQVLRFLENEIISNKWTEINRKNKYTLLMERNFYTNYVPKIKLIDYISRYK